MHLYFLKFNYDLKNKNIIIKLFQSLGVSNSSQINLLLQTFYNGRSSPLTEEERIIIKDLATRYNSLIKGSFKEILSEGGGYNFSQSCKKKIIANILKVLRKNIQSLNDLSFLWVDTLGWILINLFYVGSQQFTSLAF